MLTWLLVTLGVAIGSALFPPLSVELFVITLAARHPHYPPLLLGAVIALGQTLGKLVYYYAARGSLPLPTFLHNRVHGANQVRQPPRGAVGRWWHAVTAWLRIAWAWLREKCHRHPWWMFGSTMASSVVGIPPFMATTVLAGLAGLSLRAFVVACLPGRFIRFSLLAASPNLFMHWIPVIHHHLHLHVHWA